MTVLKNLLPLPDGILMDVMHACFIGIFKHMFEAMYTYSVHSYFLLHNLSIISLFALKKQKINRAAFFNRLNPTIYLISEMKRDFRNLSEYKKFKANEYRILCLYLAAVLFVGYWDIPDRRARHSASESAHSCPEPFVPYPQEMLLNMLLLSSAMNLLSNKAYKHVFIPLFYFTNKFYSFFRQK